MKKVVSESKRRALLREWSRSGMSARDFCEGRGLKEQQLYWWARRAAAKAHGAVDRVRLVEAIPIGTEMVPSRSAAEGKPWAWELAGPGGVLRGSELDAATLVILTAAVRTTGPR